MLPVSFCRGRSARQRFSRVLRPPLRRKGLPAPRWRRWPRPPASRRKSSTGTSPRRKSSTAPCSRALRSARERQSPGRGVPGAGVLRGVRAAREPEFADYAHDVRNRVINWVLQRRRHDDPVFHRWAAEVAVSHVRNAVLTWLDVGDPTRDEEFARRSLAGVNALWKAWSAPLK